MSLRLYVCKSRDESVADQGFSVSLTNEVCLVDVQTIIEKCGGDEVAIEFFSYGGDTHKVIAGLMCVCNECEDSIGQTLERILTDFFARGVKYGRENPPR